MDVSARRDFRKWWVFLAIAAGIAVLIAVFDWNWLRGPLAGYLSAKSGRTVAIDGDLKLELAAKPRLIAHAVSFGNAPWSTDHVMARAERLSLRLDPASLWRAPVELSEVRLVRPEVVLEKDHDGRANWDFGAGGASARISDLTIEDGVIHYRNVPAEADITIQVTSSPPKESGERPLSFSGSGRWRDNPFSMEGEAASLLALENGDRPYRLDIRARAGSTSAHFDGTVVPARIDNVIGALTVQGPDLSQLYPLIPVPLPWTPAYRLNGQLEHRSAVWYFRQFTGKVGDSDLAGDFSVEPGKKPRPLINAEVVSTRLDYKDLGGFVGLPPGNQPAVAKPRAQRTEAMKRIATERALPEKPYDLERLRAVNAKAHFRGKRFLTTDLPLDNLDVGLDLQDGVLKLQPLDFGVAGGHIVSTLVLDARQDVIRTHADVNVQDLELRQIVPALKPPNGSAGKLAGHAIFVATGNSVAQMLASSDGEAALISRGGNASALAIVLTNLDLARAIPLLMKGDESSPIRCVVADVVAENGRLATKSMIVDTQAEKIFGEGAVDFKAERYDMRLEAQSKQPSLLALRGPIVIEGTFKSPQIHPAVGPIAARVGSAVALGALTPPAALVPFIDFGHANDADCDGLMAEAMRNVKTRSSESMRVATR
jgi:AsmA family protein